MVSQTDFDIYLITDRGRILPQSYDCVVKLFPGENFSIVVTNNTNFKKASDFVTCGKILIYFSFKIYRSC